jgi:hypothetical protein
MDSFTAVLATLSCSSMYKLSVANQKIAVICGRCSELCRTYAFFLNSALVNSLFLT